MDTWKNWCHSFIIKYNIYSMPELNIFHCHLNAFWKILDINVKKCKFSKIILGGPWRSSWGTIFEDMRVSPVISVVWRLQNSLCQYQERLSDFVVWKVGVQTLLVGTGKLLNLFELQISSYIICGDNNIPSTEGHCED